MSKIIGGKEFEAVSASSVDNNSIFLDTVDNVIKMKDNSGTVSNIASSSTISPIGTIISWLKSYTNTPSLPNGWVECNGQTLSDPDSVYNGQVIPDLNGDAVTLKGSSTSGTASTTSHTHGSGSYHTVNDDTGLGQSANVAGTSSANNAGSLINTYTVVWIMRVK